MIKIQIHSIFGTVLFEHEKEGNTVRDTLLEAINIDANLRGADLRGADLRGAYLRGAYLSDAYLSDANLIGANLRGADLRGAGLRDANLIGANLIGANLRGANLSDANLIGAYLSGANLSDANLSDANLIGADLSDADLSDANLIGANLQPIKDDLFLVLLRGFHEIPFLKAQILAGKIDGTVYDGECRCLNGTLCRGAEINNGASQDMRTRSILSVRSGSRPIERFFLMIKVGDTPDNSEPCRLVMGWIEEFESFLK